jgi:H+/Cl- antiporter ClcA
LALFTTDGFPTWLKIQRHSTWLAWRAFFTAVVRAPVTGIILITEMTASFTLLLPLLSARFAAMLVPNLLRDPPFMIHCGNVL